MRISPPLKIPIRHLRRSLRTNSEMVRPFIHTPLSKRQMGSRKTISFHNSVLIRTFLPPKITSKPKKKSTASGSQLRMTMVLGMYQALPTTNPILTAFDYTKLKKECYVVE